jgi:hypothetical protein
MNSFKRWLGDPDKVFNTLSVFFAGIIVGMLIERWL